MNNDITKCTNDLCYIKEKCYRYATKPSEYYQSYCRFEPTNKDPDNYICDSFYPIKDDKKLKNGRY